MIVIRDVHEALRLLLERNDDAGMAVAEIVHGDTGHKIKVLSAVGVVDLRTAALHQYERLPSVGVHQILLRLRKNVVGDHDLQKISQS
jgi:hypothetical protein